MKQIRLLPDLAALQPRLLLLPSTLLILVSNLLPLLGVLWWGWDTFLVVMLFWMETAVFAFWAMAAILAGAPANGKETASFAGRVVIVMFFTFHSGMFMLVHMIFLWALFSGEWRDQIHGVDDFVSKIFIGSGLWLPLLISFAGRGVATLADRAPQLSTVAAPVVRSGKNNNGEEPECVIGPLYTRIVILHVVIIAGAWLAQTFGSVAPFVLLILFKSLVDLAFHLSAEAKARAHPV